MNKNLKNDKGFNFSDWTPYWKLSYRRKLICAIFEAPFLLSLVLFPKVQALVAVTPTWAFIILLLWIHFHLYNYFMWKKEEKKRELGKENKEK